MADKRLVSIALEEGFLDDRVRLRVGGREVADLPSVSTRVQIGLAHTLELELEAADSTLTVELPDKQVEKTVPLTGSPAYVGISIGDDGRTLAVRSGEAPAGYA
jgi:hypothetical protein